MAFRDWFKKNVGSADVLRMIAGENRSISGVNVNYDSSLHVSTVLACAAAVSDDLAQVPWKVYRKKSATQSNEEADHPVYKLLHSSPNEWQTAFEFRAQRVIHLMLAGNAFAFIVRKSTGEVTELLPLEPQWVTVKLTGIKQWGVVYDVVWPSGQKQENIPAENIWHSRGRQWTMHMGLDAVKLAREAIGISMSSENHASQMFGNGARPSGIISFQERLTAEQLDSVRRIWEENYTGRGTGRTAVLAGGAKFEATTFSAEESGENSTRKFQIEDICRHMGVFPARIGFSDKASTYASVEQFFLAHAQFTIAPRAVSLNQSANKALLTEKELEAGLYTEHNLNGLMRGASEARAGFYKSGIGDGWMTRNEARAFEGMNPIDGLDLPLTPLNMGDGTKPPEPPPKPAPVAAPADVPAPKPKPNGAAAAAA